jgi:cytochrome c oxidase subunit 2
MEKKDKVVLVVAILAAFAIGLSIGNMFWMSRYQTYPSQTPYQPMMGPMQGYQQPMMGYSPQPAQYKSNGELIFMTGVNEKGERIPFVGGPQWLYMHGGGCASCHGTDGKGGIYPMMCGVKTPDIRYSTLTEEHGMTEEDIKKAITQGVDDEGEELDYCMPRWQMSEKDLNDVIEYLKEL